MIVRKNQDQQTNKMHCRFVKEDNTWKNFVLPVQVESLIPPCRKRRNKPTPKASNHSGCFVL